MCRVAARAAPRARAEGEALALGLENEVSFAAADNLSFEDLFGGDGALDLDEGDMDLLKLFNAGSAEQASAVGPGAEGSVAAPSSTVDTDTAVLGQPVDAAQAASFNQAAGVDVVQALLQQQTAAALMPAVYGAQAAQTSLYQQALMQQMLTAQQPAAVAAPAVEAAAAPAPSAATAPPPALQAAPGATGSKRHKTQAEIEEQIERTKKRRRESAQRSRQRKNCYMRSLEIENEALKREVERLRSQLTKQLTAPGEEGKATSDSSSKPYALPGRPPVAPCVVKACSSDDFSAGACRADGSGLGAPVATGLFQFAL